MKKIVICLLAMLMLAGCSSNTQNATTETTTPTTAEATETAAAVEVNDEMYATFVESYYSGEHKSDYTSSSNPYVFKDGAEADLALIKAHFECDAITEDEAVLTSIQEFQTEQVAAFEELLRSFKPVLDEASYDNAKTIIMFKDAQGNLMYINSDGLAKIVMGEARGNFRLSADELEALTTFLTDNVAFYETLEVCGVAAE
ncbi:MAG: hypothetical protein MR210_01640 [Erysipelotrichaceae bacterium]|nr:hypothetical protein [Erysipelotrichaceae bacterium]MDY5251734.1 hypothetical protein [Erysipelotrichaceae bacterium]